MAAKQNIRETYIAKIMSEKYGDDDPKYDDQNIAFLESLSLNELKNLADGEFEDVEIEEDIDDAVDGMIEEDEDSTYYNTDEY